MRHVDHDAVKGVGDVGCGADGLGRLRMVEMESDWDFGVLAGGGGELDQEVVGCVGLGPWEEEDLRGGAFRLGGADDGGYCFEVVL